MKKKQFKRQIERIKQLEAKWDGILGMGWWQIEDVYLRHGLPDEDNDPDDLKENWRPVARARIKWPYRQLTVRWDMPMVAESSDEQLESHFVHERVHALVNEMREWAVNHEDGAVISHEERVVCMLTSAFLWVYSAGRESAAKEANDDDSSVAERDTAPDVMPITERVCTPDRAAVVVNR